MHIRPNHQTDDNTFWIPLLAAAVALAVVHGMGRFAYTPLLPLLINDGFFSLGDGAHAATLNYIGYLLGAMLAIRLHQAEQIRRLLPVALFISAASTLLQALCSDYDFFLGLRLINGITNGIVFVQAPALVLEWLSRRGMAALSGLMYFGVGVGMLASSALASWPSALLSGSARWWPMALAAVPMAIWSAFSLVRLDRPAKGTAAATVTATQNTPLFDRASIPLFMAYAGAGLGYILPTTFLPVVAQEQLPPEHWLTSGAWLLLGLASLLAAWLWNRMGARFGDRHALLANYVLQGCGVAAPLWLSGALGVLLCALLVGMTFLGSVLLTQRLARTLHPHQGPRISAALITLYSFAQLCGPWLARQWIERGGSMTDTYWLGTAALIWSLFWTWRTPEHNS